MSRLLSRVANSITSRQIFVKCVIQVGQPPFLQRFRRSVGHPPPVLNNVRAILSFFTCRRRPDVSGTPQHATQNIFCKKIPLRQVFPSASVSIHAKTAHSRQKQPWAGAFSLCQFIQPYGNVGVRELELVGKVGFRFVLLRRHAHHNAAHVKASGG